LHDDLRKPYGIRIAFLAGPWKWPGVFAMPLQEAFGEEVHGAKIEILLRKSMGHGAWSME